MNSRYPAPMAEKIWSDEARAERLRTITDIYAIDAHERGLLGIEIDPDVFVNAGPIDLGGWGEAEAKHGHEIVAFLDVYLQRLPKEIHPLVHYGLTSSDLVEYDLHQAISQHSIALGLLVRLLASQIEEKAGQFPIERAGRTHGQTAESTHLDHQLMIHSDVLAQIAKDLPQEVPIKTPGPTGCSTLRTAVKPNSRSFVVRSTQIVPRDYLLKWACTYLRLANELDSLATFVRLGCRSEIGEFREGASLGRIGSSAMPGKHNPIQSERVCGLARVTRGHFLALAEVSNLWEDRDLSNSSTERLSVPGLASVVEYMTNTMFEVISDLEIDTSRIWLNVQDDRTSANARQNWLQKHNRLSPLEASRRARG